MTTVKCEALRRGAIEGAKLHRELKSGIESTSRGDSVLKRIAFLEDLPHMLEQKLARGSDGVQQLLASPCEREANSPDVELVLQGKLLSIYGEARRRIREVLKVQRIVLRADECTNDDWRTHRRMYVQLYLELREGYYGALGIEHRELLHRVFQLGNVHVHPRKRDPGADLVLPLTGIPHSCVTTKRW